MYNRIMKIILLVTVCKQYKSRIQNQIDNLKNLPKVNGVEWHPIFLFAEDNKTLDITIPYDILTVNVEERYNILYRKMFAAYKAVDAKYNYDFICKIDDDTKINLDVFDPEWIRGKDYVGGMYSSSARLNITFDFDFYHIHKTVSLVPDFLNKIKSEFASGDLYFLSKKAVKHILTTEKIIEECEGLRAYEDRLFGYLLHDKGMVTSDIKLMNEDVEENRLQVTNNYFSIHPIHDMLFPQLIGKSPKEQFDFICNSPTLNLLRRSAYIKDLERRILETVNDFVNSPKSMGLG